MLSRESEKNVSICSAHKIKNECKGNILQIILKIRWYWENKLRRMLLIFLGLLQKHSATISKIYLAKRKNNVQETRNNMEEERRGDGRLLFRKCRAVVETWKWKKETVAVVMAAPGNKLQCLQQQRPDSTTDRMRQHITEVRRIRILTPFGASPTRWIVA